MAKPDLKDIAENATDANKKLMHAAVGDLTVDSDAHAIICMAACIANAIACGLTVDRAYVNRTLNDFAFRTARK